MDVVAYALVVSAIVKSVCDYAGTYLVNYAGFGMITDLRNDLYNAVLRRSVAFFQKHTTGTLLSTLINDIERVQTAMSSVLGDFLQQLFTLIFMAGVVIVFGGKMAWVLLLFVSGGDLFGAAHWAAGAADDTQGAGQTGRDSEHPARDDYGQPHCEGVWDGAVGDEPVSPGGEAVVPREPAIGERAGDQFAADGCAWVRWGLRCCCCWDATGSRHDEMTIGSFISFLIAVFTLYDPVRKFALFYNSFQQALGASEEIFKFMDAQDDVQEKKRAFVLKGFKRGDSV